MLPLDGITILDLTRLLPGAYATLLLADMGADVVKIEDPRGGDPMRRTPPLREGDSVYHHALNRNKRSVTVNLREREAQTVLDALLSSADVLVESFRPSTARRLKVTAADVQARHPRVVHCAITGFGQSGPYVERAGHDINYVALAGLPGLDRESGGEPVRTPRTLVADLAGGGLSAVNGILAALLERERTGRAPSVDVAMYEGALGFLLFPAARAIVDGGDLEPDDLPVTRWGACYSVYKTADDKYVALGALEPAFWARFCERIGRPDLIGSQFVEGDRQRVRDEIATLMRSRTRDEWVRLFEGVDACFTAVNTVDEALRDPHARARGAVVEVGGVRYIRSTPRFEMTPEGPAKAGRHEQAEAGHHARAAVGQNDRDAAAPKIRPARKLGADTDEILAAAGFDRAAIARLRAAGVI